MTTIVKVHRNGQMTLPSAIRTAMGITGGDLVEATILRGKIVLTPKPAVDSSNLPKAVDEYTPRQRRYIDARLAKSEEDIRKGRVFGPFETHDEFITALHKESAKLVRNKTKRSVR